MIKRILVAALVSVFGMSSASAQSSNPYNNIDVRNGSPVLNICTGNQGGGYFEAGQVIAKHLAPVAIGNVIASKGTEANLNGAMAIQTGSGAVGYNGKQYGCHIFLYQKDGTTAFPATNSVVEQVSTLYNEPAILIVKDGAGFKSIDDFIKKGSVCVQSGSGAATTLKAFGNLEKDYARVANAMEERRSWGDCLEDVKAGTVQGVFYVGSPSSQFMKDVDNQAKNSKLTIAKIKDNDLNSVYTPVEIRSSVFRNLLGWSNVDTVSVQSMIGMSKPLADMLDRRGSLDPIKDRLRRAANEINTKYQNNNPLAY